MTAPVSTICCEMSQPWTWIIERFFPPHPRRMRHVPSDRARGLANNTLTRAWSGLVAARVTLARRYRSCQGGP